MPDKQIHFGNFKLTSLFEVVATNRDLFYVYGDLIKRIRFCRAYNEERKFIPLFFSMYIELHDFTTLFDKTHVEKRWWDIYLKRY